MIFTNTGDQKDISFYIDPFICCCVVPVGLVDKVIYHHHGIGIQ